MDITLVQLRRSDSEVVELYKRMSSVFAEKITNLINETRTTGKLPDHFLEGDISMLYKKGDREDPRNYRPITLLNSDYKVFTRVLSKRMITVVHQFVSECQKGFVPDVFMIETTRFNKNKLIYDDGYKPWIAGDRCVLEGG